MSAMGDKAAVRLLSDFVTKGGMRTFAAIAINFYQSVLYSVRQVASLREFRLSHSYRIDYLKFKTL